jgi:alpha-methylacyl-CoA racemase
MSGPLKGIRIVEMVGLGPCPFAAMMLSDMGAEIIRIDRQPTGGPTPYPMQARGSMSWRAGAVPSRWT